MKKTLSAHQFKLDSALGPLKIHVRIDPQKLIRNIFFWLLGFEAILFLLDLVINYSQWIPLSSVRQLFNLAREDSLANWFSGLQTLVVGVVLWMTWYRVRYTEISLWRKRGWALLAVMFTYLGVDDGARIHERIGSSARDLATQMGSGGLSHFLRDELPGYPWQVIFGPFFFAMGLLIVWFILKEFQNHRLKQILSLALLCYILAVGLDFVEGWEGIYQRIAHFLGLTKYTISHFSKITEEFLEMFGTTLFLTAFLHHFTFLTHKLKISLK